MRVDLPVMLLSLAVAVMCGLLFGLAPLLNIRSDAMAEALKSGGRGSSGTGRHHVRRMLVSAETAIAVIVVVGAGLLVQTVHNLTAVDTGFERSRLATFSIALPRASFDILGRVRAYQRILDQLPLESLASTIQQAVRDVDPAVPVARLREMDEVFTASIRRPRLVAELLTLFSILALLLAAVGIYGLLSCTVTEPRREIGIRFAIGATCSAVLIGVVRQGLVLTITGIVIGLAGAVALNKLLASLLFGVKPTDTTTLIMASAAITLVAAVACWIPAWRRLSWIRTSCSGMSDILALLSCGKSLHCYAESMLQKAYILRLPAGRRDSNFRPSCTWRALKIEGPDASVGERMIKGVLHWPDRIGPMPPSPGLGVYCSMKSKPRSFATPGKPAGPNVSRLETLQSGLVSCCCRGGL